MGTSECRLAHDLQQFFVGIASSATAEDQPLTCAADGASEAGNVTAWARAVLEQKQAGQTEPAAVKMSRGLSSSCEHAWLLRVEAPDLRAARGAFPWRFAPTSSAPRVGRVARIG